jgi:hypothetical protein
MRTGPDAKLRPALFVSPSARRISYSNGATKSHAFKGLLMRKMLAVLTAVLVLNLVLGCGSDKEKGQNRDKDKPRAGETAK